VGHNPFARIGVALLFLLLTAQIATGLIIAVTDVYRAPLGAPDFLPGPSVEDLIAQSASNTIRDIRAALVPVHALTFYALAVAITLHVIAVVATELHDGGSLTSAMFTGRKVLKRKPPDV
jgi:cytochrome b